MTDQGLNVLWAMLVLSTTLIVALFYLDRNFPDKD